VTTVADGEPDLVCRRARPADREAVVAFTEDTWADRGTGDYVPRRYDAWMDADDGETAVTVLFDASEEGTAPTDEVAAIVRAVMLSEWEGWLHGLRVNPDYRRHGLGTRLTRVGFDWVRERGGRVARSWIHSWNAPSLGLSRTAGFDPAVEYRMVYPDPDADATPDADLNDPTGPGDADVPRRCTPLTTPTRWATRTRTPRGPTGRTRPSGRRLPGSSSTTRRRGPSRR
jgi:GNAT superfamily N-acetyltransferase